jgi:hypothetical protein
VGRRGAGEGVGLGGGWPAGAEQLVHGGFVLVAAGHAEVAAVEAGVAHVRLPGSGDVPRLKAAVNAEPDTWRVAGPGALRNRRFAPHGGLVMLWQGPACPSH